MKKGSSEALLLFVLFATLTGCKNCNPEECVQPPCNEIATPYTIEIPPFFPPMDIPADNPLTEEGIELGRLLFWEKELSADGSMSCGSCHLPSSGFADPSAVSTGITGAQGLRNAMAIVNIGWTPSFFWDGRATFIGRANFRTRIAPRRNGTSLERSGFETAKYANIRSGSNKLPSTLRASFWNL